MFLSPVVIACLAYYGSRFAGHLTPKVQQLDMKRETKMKVWVRIIQRDGSKLFELCLHSLLLSVRYVYMWVFDGPGSYSFSKCTLHKHNYFRYYVFVWGFFSL